MKQNGAQGRGVMGLEGGGWLAERVDEDRTWGLSAAGCRMTLGLTRGQLSVSSLSGQSRSSTGLSLDDRRQRCCWAQKGTREAPPFWRPRPAGPPAQHVWACGPFHFPVRIATPRQCRLSPT